MKQLLTLFLFAPLASGELVDVTLTLTPATASENTLALGVSAILSSSDNSEASGTVVARIEIDPASGEISTLQFLSGDISASAVTFQAGFGTFGYSLQSSVLGATLETLNPPSAVTAGQSPAEEHQLTINSGTLGGSALGNSIPTQDFATAPISGTGEEGSFLSIGATENAALSNPALKVYDLEFTFPVNISQLIEVDTSFSATVTVAGNVRATGQTSFPITPGNPYLAWAAANGITGASFVGNNFSDALPNGLAWALGHVTGTEPTGLEPNGDGSFSVAPAAGGTVADVEVQLSFDLSNPNGWSTISTIAEGSTGVQGPYGAGPGPAFLRLMAANPAE